MSGHTPTPWTTGVFFTGDEDQRAIVSGPRGELIARSYFVGDEPEANIAFIVQAVNAHDALVAALTGLIELKTASEAEELDGPMENWFPAKEIDRRWNDARIALALARGEQS